MDRRDQPERTADNSLTKALNVIVQSYQGVNPERLFHEAITCFDGLIEISLGTDAIRDFAHQQGRDLKFLVDGANFVISKMHFNPESNFYLTLGLPRNTSAEEIRQRWKRLMLLYHPDRQNGEEGWVSERAKKVNEAYSTLKDDTKRAGYDRKLLDQNFAQVNGQRHENVPTARPHHPSQRRSKTIGPRRSAAWAHFSRYVPKILITFYIIVALVVLSIIYIQNRTENLESELTPQPAANRQAMTVTEQRPADLVVPASPATSSSSVPAESKRPQGGLPGTSSGSSRDSSFWKRLFGKNQSAPSSATTVTGNEGSVKQDTAPGVESAGAGTAGPVPVQTPAPVEIRQPERLPADRNLQKTDSSAPDAPPAPEVRSTQMAKISPAQQITREEVDEFMQRYTTAYSRGDLNAFLSLFSLSATENNSLHYQDIRNAYRETFAEKINHYKLQNMTTKFEGESAFVTGTYQVNRYFSKEDRWVRHSGKISWKLAKENNALKITSLNYDK